MRHLILRMKKGVKGGQGPDAPFIFMKNEDWVTYKGWMINELQLEKAELFVYATIYGYTKFGKGEFKGTIRYLCECTTSSRATVFRALTALQNKGYIEKIEEKDEFGISIPKYTAFDLDEIVKKKSDNKEVKKPNPKQEKSALDDLTHPVRKSDTPSHTDFDPSLTDTQPVSPRDTISISKAIYKQEEEALFEKNEFDPSKIDAKSDAVVYHPAPPPAPKNSESLVVSFPVVFDPELILESYEAVTTALANNDAKKLESEIGQVNMRNLKEVYGKTEALTMSGNTTLLLCYWLAHKHTKRQNYKPKGLETLIAQMRKYDSRYVKEKVELGMANGYTGLFFPGEDDKYEQWKKHQQVTELHCELLNQEYTDKIEKYLKEANYDMELLKTKDTGMLAWPTWTPQAKIAATIWNFRLAYAQNGKVRHLAKENPNIFTFADIKNLIIMDCKYTTSERCTMVWTALLDIQFENREKVLKEKGFVGYILFRLAQNN
jgi:predicted transcriptional regulator